MIQVFLQVKSSYKSLVIFVRVPQVTAQLAPFEELLHADSDNDVLTATLTSVSTWLGNWPECCRNKCNSMKIMNMH